MKSYAPFALVAVFGIAAIVIADSSSIATVHSDSADSNPRFTIHGEGENRLLFDRRTGETWAMRTVLNAEFDRDPEPIAVWFPVPRADSKLSESIVRSRLSLLKLLRDEENDKQKGHLAQQEREKGSDDPSVLQARKELQVYSDAYGVEIGKQLLPLFAP